MPFSSRNDVIEVPRAAAAMTSLCQETADTISTKSPGTKMTVFPVKVLVTAYAWETILDVQLVDKIRYVVLMIHSVGGALVVEQYA